MVRNTPCSLKYLYILSKVFFTMFPKVSIYTKQVSCHCCKVDHCTLEFHYSSVLLRYPECPAGSFGPRCRQRCQCDNRASCDHVSGACTCKVGWTGTYCEKGECGGDERLLLPNPLLLPTLSSCPVSSHASL